MDSLSTLSAYQQPLTFLLGGAICYLVALCFWRLYFHPLSKYPGPRLAAISDAWYTYHAMSGRLFWAIEDALRIYGDTVRIAPNELVFVSPRALADLYSSHTRNIEVFPKTQINNHGNDEHGGLLWEWDPVRHRRVAKQMSPAFSGRALQAKETALHTYIDLFVSRMKEYGASPEGISLTAWVNWLCVDISADMAYNWEMNAMKDMRNPPYLDILYGINKGIVAIQMSWRFPLLGWLKYIYLLRSPIRSHAAIRAHSSQRIQQRIRRKGAVKHLDFFEQIIPENREPPEDPREMRHLEQIAGQLLVAGYEPPSIWFYFTIVYLVQNPDVLDTLKAEIRAAFDRYEDIRPAKAASLPYLTACLKESLRLAPVILTGMPVVSPGAKVDGEFIPKGVVCQSSTFALARSPRNFLEPREFRPQRWLQEGHPLYEPRFANDKRDDFHPFSQGPRICAGREIAWWQSRLFIAKVLWTFDLELGPGQDVDVDRDLKGYSMYIKPEVRVRFLPVTRGCHA
ncbi:cytochrome P450 [Xylariomycetidae sp. FL0641]|nr:cytochrome P450 [Xylariomycetidae sp. FL0641]